MTVGAGSSRRGVGAEARAEMGGGALSCVGTAALAIGLSRAPLPAPAAEISEALRRALTAYEAGDAGTARDAAAAVGRALDTAAASRLAAHLPDAPQRWLRLPCNSRPVEGVPVFEGVSACASSAAEADGATPRATFSSGSVATDTTVDAMRTAVAAGDPKMRRCPGGLDGVPCWRHGLSVKGLVDAWIVLGIQTDGPVATLDLLLDPIGIGALETGR